MITWKQMSKYNERVVVSLQNVMDYLSDYNIKHLVGNKGWRVKVEVNLLPWENIKNIEKALCPRIRYITL